MGQQEFKFYNHGAFWILLTLELLKECGLNEFVTHQTLLWYSVHKWTLIIPNAVSSLGTIGYRIDLGSQNLVNANLDLYIKICLVYDL